MPSKLSIVSESETKGIYEIDGLYPGYGHTLGNSLRRIILSSLPGAAITSIKIEGADHEFSAIDGVKEDVITILLHLKKVRFRLLTDEPQVVKLSVKGPKAVHASDIEVSGQVEVLNKDLYIAEVTGKKTLEIEMTVSKGLGFVSKDVHQKSKTEVGVIAVDAIFTPIRRVNYEVENMRVGDRTDFNRLRILIETNGTVSPREALEKSIEIMIHQLKSVIGFQEESASSSESMTMAATPTVGKDPSKMKIDELEIATRTATALADGGIKSVAGLIRKSASALKELDGVGDKAIAEITEALEKLGLELKGE